MMGKQANTAEFVEEIGQTAAPHFSLGLSKGRSSDNHQQTDMVPRSYRFASVFQKREKVSEGRVFSKLDGVVPGAPPLTIDGMWWLRRCGRVLLVVILVVDLVDSRGFHGIPGRYCSVRTPTCCTNRDDDCTAPILGDHLCYCDMFCDRGPDGGNDCCPDFEATCRGGDERGSWQLSGEACVVDGVHYNEGDQIQRNCEQCTCRSNMWSCDGTTCLIQPDILDKVKTGRYSWSARNYTNFWGRSLSDGIKFRLGTLFPEQSVQNMNEIVIKPRELPESFDAREKWGALIHPVLDQGDCGSSWSVSTTTISSDRLSIISDGKIKASISPQQLLSCNQHRQRGCEGGYLDRAWWYIRKLGVVSEECYPYVSGVSREPGHCLIPKRNYTNGQGIRCPTGHPDSTAYKMTPPYRVSNREEDIMTELITNGPVQATFLVHEDFFMYSGGVYQHSGLASQKGAGAVGEGYHSVRVLGWGVDHSTGRAIKYWLAANSWGSDWGEEGLFRIIRGENHCEFESFVIGAWGKGAKRRRRFKMRKTSSS
ncbi:unnamed protein product [Caenorhabditis auriculariae]|uniref:SMB domain-containing protein n=1 Tax=Caenorhabditis auriculariae TaxID=2777116 RepID=A0A8S1HWE2_9PELO|nr:unnamed protein product [Caenorhabditis auriculariae]